MFAQAQSADSVRKQNWRHAPAKLQADWDSLKTLLTETHTDLRAYVSEAELEFLYERVERAIEDSMTSKTFFKLVNPIFIALKDVHSRIWLPRLYNDYAMQGGYYLPINVRFLAEKTYIFFDRDSLIPKGSELLTINGFSADFIRDSLAGQTYTDGDNRGTRLRLLEESFYTQLPLFFRIDSLNLLRIIRPGQTNDTVIQVKGIQRLPTGPPPSKRKRVRPPKPDWQKTFDFQYLAGDSVGLMKINSFSRGSYARYTRFLRKSFKALNQQETPYLVIDLRGNKGGYISRGPILMNYLTDKEYLYVANSIVKASPGFRNKIKENFFWPGLSIPLLAPVLSDELVSGWKNPTGVLDTVAWEPIKPRGKRKRYQGEIFLLTDGLSISNSSLVRSAFSQYKMGLVVGLPCGGSANGTFGNSIDFQLPHTGLAGRLSTMRINSFEADYAYDPQPMEPDYRVPYLLPDLLDDTDTQVQFILELIRNRR